MRIVRPDRNWIGDGVRIAGTRLGIACPVAAVRPRIFVRVRSRGLGEEATARERNGENKGSDRHKSNALHNTGQLEIQCENDAKPPLGHVLKHSRRTTDTTDTQRSITDREPEAPSRICFPPYA